MWAYLILNEELDTLDWGSSSFRDGGGNTTHCTNQSVTFDSNIPHNNDMFLAEGGRRPRHVTPLGH